MKNVWLHDHTIPLENIYFFTIRPVYMYIFNIINVFAVTNHLIQYIVVEEKYVNGITVYCISNGEHFFFKKQLKLSQFWNDIHFDTLQIIIIKYTVVFFIYLFFTEFDWRNVVSFNLESLNLNQKLHRRVISVLIWVQIGWLQRIEHPILNQLEH